MLILKPPSTFDILDLILLEQILDPSCESFDGFVFRFHHLREVEFDVADFDAAVFEVVEGLVVELGVVEEGFRGDAADV